METRHITTAATEQAIIMEERSGKRPQILGKTNLLKIPNDRSPVIGYEAFITQSDLGLDPSQFAEIPTGIVVGAHNVTAAEVEGKRYMFDLSDEGKMGDFWEEGLKKTIDLVAALGGSYVTTHLGEFDPISEMKLDTNSTDEQIITSYEEVKRGRILSAAQRITRLDAYAQERGIQLAVENDTYWVVTKFGAMLLNDIEAFKLLFANIPESVGVVLDAEHAYRAAVVGPVWNNYMIRHIRETDKMAVARELLGDLSSQILGFKIVDKEDREIGGPSAFLKANIKPIIEELLQHIGTRVIALHDCGWDFSIDSSDVTNPTIGTSVQDAHLPPRRVISTVGDEGIKLVDGIDHGHILSTLHTIQSDEVFKRLKVVLEYAGHLDNRRYNLPSQGPNVEQSREDEFGIAARSMRHILSRILKESVHA